LEGVGPVDGTTVTDGKRTGKCELPAVAQGGLVASQTIVGRLDWLRAQTAVSLRWVSERLAMGHYSNAGRGPRKMRAEDRRKFQQALAKLAGKAGSEE